MNILHPVSFSDSDIAALKRLLEESEGISISCNQEISGIWLTSDTRETELRLLLLMGFRLTVSRVCFVHRRQGTMTKVLSFLEDFCRREGVSEIVVQMVETSEMANWCLKNGFQPIPSATMAINGLLIGDYRKEVVES